jgi:hypothetical protein
MSFGELLLSFLFFPVWAATTLVLFGIVRGVDHCTGGRLRVDLGGVVGAVLAIVIMASVGCLLIIDLPFAHPVCRQLGF